MPALLIRGCNALQRVSHDGSDGVHFGRLDWDLSRSTTVRSIGWPADVTDTSRIWQDIAHLTLTLPGGERFEFDDCWVGVNRRGGRIPAL